MFIILPIFFRKTGAYKLDKTLTNSLPSETFTTYEVRLFDVFWFRFIEQAPVAQTMDSAISRINHYPVDSAIHRLNNWGQQVKLFLLPSQERTLSPT